MIVFPGLQRTAPTPEQTVSTNENNSAYRKAHKLIEEMNMRNTTRLSILALSLSACMGNVGGGPSTRPRDGETSCDSPEKIESDITIQSQADFDDLPACWDLWGKLTLDGSAVTSLAGLGTLVGVNELHILDTELVTLDATEKLKVYGPVAIVGNAKLTNLANLEVEADDQHFLGQIAKFGGGVQRFSQHTAQATIAVLRAGHSADVAQVVDPGIVEDDRSLIVIQPAQTSCAQAAGEPQGDDAAGRIAGQQLGSIQPARHGGVKPFEHSRRQ